MGLSYQEVAAQAGCDPLKTVSALQEANPGEVSALADLFIAAAASLQTSKSISLEGTTAATQAATIDDATPVDLMAEVEVTAQSLAASPEQLQQIGSLLHEVAAQIPGAQQQADAALQSMEAQLAQLQAQWSAVAEPVEAGVVDPRPQLLAEAIAVVQIADGEVTSIVQAHDQYLASIDAQLQACGYITPPDVSAGDAGTVTVPAGSPDLSGQTAPEVMAAWWAGLTPQQQAFYLKHYGDDLATTHGLPAEVYDVVNRRALTDDEISADAAVVAAAHEYAEQRGLSQDIPIEDLITLAEEDLADVDIDSIHEADSAAAFMAVVGGAAMAKKGIDNAQKSLAHKEGEAEKYLLEYALDGPGNESTAVIAIGNPDDADNIAVTVPGTDNGIDSIDDQVATGEAVKGSMDDAAPAEDNAVIVYQGYDNPDDIPEAMLDLAAEDGGAALADDVAGYDAANVQADGSGPHITTIGHSYGSLVVSEAVQDQYSSLADALFGGPSIDDVVVVGSPGMNVENAEELGIDPEHVYAGATDDDPVVELSYVANLASDVFAANTTAGQALELLSEALDQSPFDFGLDLDLHNTVPTDPSFGAQVFSTDGSSGHSEYFDEDSESLANIAKIAVGG